MFGITYMNVFFIFIKRKFTAEDFFYTRAYFDQKKSFYEIVINLINFIFFLFQFLF